ncbi:MAG: hypothetical protein DMD99_02255 [Candidatus Rokuibacteriota bacterium]|nr:MAG: hypothetical protein DMD99_02255 [Candidatus Rokubacteria bacterium]
MKTSMNRRAFLRGAAALGVAAHADMAGAAQEASPGRGSFPLPARGEFVIRGAYVMTMDPTLGDIPRGDVHVKNGAIVAVGAGLKAGGAQVLDGRDMIVLPGFVDTHWHMWNTLLRSMAGDKRELGYFPTVATLGKVFTPNDMYQGTRLSAVEALYSGFTFVHDWCHNIRGPEFAAASLRALRESGLRGRFSYGTPRPIPRPRRSIWLISSASRAPGRATRARGCSIWVSPGAAWARRRLRSRPRSIGRSSTRRAARASRSRCTSPTSVRGRARSKRWPRPTCSARTCSSSTPSGSRLKRSRVSPPPARR